MDHVRNLWSSYLQWVAEHPQLATDIETSIKWISYIATGNGFVHITALLQPSDCLSECCQNEVLKTDAKNQAFFLQKVT